MFFTGEDEEMDFSSSTGRSKLASLFDMDRAASQGGNESLTYTAPKEPKKRPDAPNQSTGSTGAAAPAILFAGVAFAYKFKDEKYASEGKLGVAVIGNHANNDYKLLLYLSKEKPVTFAKINAAFLFTVQPNNYVNFYDDSLQSWSLMFESEAILVQFAKQVAVSKFCNGQTANRDLVVAQDLGPGEGHALEAGDHIEIKYTGWQFENNAIGTMFDNDQLFRIRIGKQKAIRAWEEGVVGMKKNGKRLLICAPSMVTGGELKEGKIPLGIPIVFEVEVVRVKFGRERANDGSVPASVPQVANDDKDEDKEDGIRTKSKSISDQMAQQSSKSDKAKLISRMAKMGQPMLPVAVVPQADNTETESSPVSPNVRPEVPAKPAQHGTSAAQQGTGALPASAAPAAVNIVPETAFIPQNVMPPLGHMMGQQHFQGPASIAGMMPAATGQLSIYHSQLPMPYQAMMGYPGVSAAQPFGGMYPPSQIYPAPPPQPPPQPPPVSQSMGDSSVPMMLMETRNQNTEVRVSLSRVSDKVDRIAEKLDQMSSRQASAVSLTNSMPTMEVGMLISNIERIVMENERLRKENLEKSSRVEDQNIKIAELLQRNQLYVEQSNAFLEQRNDSYKNTASQSQARVQSLEQEKVQLAMDLSMTTSQLASCQLEVSALKKREGELKQQLDRFVTADIQGREDFGSMRMRLAEQELRLDQLAAQLKEEQQDKRILMKQNEDLKENLNDMTMERDNLDKNLNERKRKATEEVARMETEAKEMQATFEAELTTLRNRLKMERNSTETTATQKLTQIEDDLNREWKEKCDRLVSSAQEKHQRELVEVNNEKAWLQEKVDSMEAKLAEFKSLRSSHESEKERLQEQVEQLATWKDKYDNLRSQASSMKERYEQRLKELEEERGTADEEREKAEQERDRAEEKARRLQTQLSSSQPPGGATGPENTKEAVAAEVKKIMNTVYRKLRQEFSPDGVYQGSDIQAVILENVKAITLELVQNKGPAAGGASVSLPRPSAANQEAEKPVARTAGPSTETAPTSVPEPKAALSSSGSEETSRKSKEDSGSSHPVESATDGSDRGSTISASPSREVTLDVGESAVNIPSDSSIRESRGSPESRNAIDDASESSVKPDSISDRSQEIEIVQSPATVQSQNTATIDVTEEPVTGEPVTQEHVTREPLTQEPGMQEPVADKTVVEEDEDSFESFGSGDKDEPRNLEDGSAEQKSLVENAEESIDARPVEKEKGSLGNADSKSPPDTTLDIGSSSDGKGVEGSNDVRAEGSSNVREVDDDEDLFSTVAKQDSGSKRANDQSAMAGDPLRTAEEEESRKADAAVTVAKDIPLFGDDDDVGTEGVTPSRARKDPVVPKSSSLFGGLDEEDDDGLFSLASKALPADKKSSRPSSGTAKQNSASDPNKPTTKPKRNESDDDLAKKPPPLPLFGDSDDDKDLDWLS